MNKTSDGMQYRDLSQHSPIPYEGDEVSEQMTASYSEISFNPQITQNNLELDIDKIAMCDRPASISSEGTFHLDGEMTHFVAQDLEHKIKLASPNVKPNDITDIGTSITSLYMPFHQVNGDILNDLEMETQRIATSIDTLTENLCGILHSISSITADNVNTYKNAVIKMTDAMDANIKGMYTLVAKAEEVSQVMKPVATYSARIKEIKRLVDLFDSNL